MLFARFFYGLRSAGVPVSTHNWLALLQALVHGLHGQELRGFYEVARCLLCSSEAHYDAFDRVFAETFRDVDVQRAPMLEALRAWLEDPARHPGLDAQALAALQALDLDALRRELAERLQTQRERHEGGSHWIGTGGTSPFGQGGIHPTGLRLGQGGGKTALAVASARRFADYRRDRVLDTRQIGAALRQLRRMGRRGDSSELDIDATIDASAKQAGDLELRYRPPRKNDMRVLLLMDVGGSMDPSAHLVERLFSAATRSGGFRELRAYYFHNCVYGEVYEDAGFSRAVSTGSLLHLPGVHWTLIIVGDAAMHPSELSMASGRWWAAESGHSGLEWLRTLRGRFARSVWINPDPPQFWNARSLAIIGEIFPMVPLSLEGLEELVASVR